MPRALITGITGQDGSYLTELLLAKEYDVHGLVRRSSTLGRERLDQLRGPLTLHYGDLTDTTSLRRILEEVAPDELYNLAAQSHVGVSFDLAEYTAGVTALGPVRLLDAIRASGLRCRFYQAGSSEIFGQATESPQHEGTRLAPRSPYGCAKAYAFFVTRLYREAYGLYAVNGVLFNHESPRRGETFVTRKITLGIARHLAGQPGGFTLGALEARRDWGYAPEYVEGIWRMLQQPVPDDYVLATGRSTSVREFLELCLRHAGIPFVARGVGSDEVYLHARTGDVLVAIDPRHERPADIALPIGDASKARRELGWAPATSVEELAALMVDADCHRLGVPQRTPASHVA